MLKIYCRLCSRMLFLFIALIITACGSNVASTPAVVTVVQTVPVEITRMVQITKAVEVTREVVVTQVVQVPVTVTPENPVATPTPVASATLVFNPTPGTPQVTPQEKGTGFTPVFIYNQTKNKIGLTISGPTTSTLTMWPGDAQKIWVLQGNYTYIITLNDQKGYDGKFKIVNPDKHQFFIYDNKAVLWGP